MAQDVVINGVNYENVPAVSIPKSSSGTAVFYDTADGNLTADDLVAGKKGYGSSGAVEGNVTNNGILTAQISQKAQEVSLSGKYSSGSVVKISTTEQAKIVAGNIKSGVTILGQAGGLTLPTISQDSTTKILSIS